MKRIILCFYLVMLPLAAGHTEQFQEVSNELTDAEKIYGLTLFWQEVNYSFVYFDQVPDLNWDSTFKAFIPQVLATENTYDYYRTLQRFAALLNDGHTSVTMPQHYWDSLDRPKIGLLEMQERIYISNVDTSLKGVIPIGSEVIAVDKIPTAEYMATDVFPYYSSSTNHWLWYWCGFRMLAGRRDTEVELTYLTPARDTQVISMVRNRAGLEWYPPLEYSKELTEFRWIEDSIAYVALNGFHDYKAVDEFEDYLSELKSARGLIIDLRENGGGDTGIGARILSHFTTDTLVGSTWKTREHRGAHKAWGRFDTLSATENRAYFEGKAWYNGSPYKHPPADSVILTYPVVILMNHSTASAAEDFLVMCDQLRNISLVGEPSNGSTGQPLQFDLPGGGRGHVCAKRDTYPDGRDFVGIGVQPDILVEPSPQDVFSDNDVILQRAVSHLISVLVND